MNFSACASVVFKEAEEKHVHETVSDQDGEFERQRKEKMPKTRADIARCWAKYCLNLIKEGKERLEKAAESSLEEETGETGETPGKVMKVI